MTVKSDFSASIWWRHRSGPVGKPVQQQDRWTVAPDRDRETFQSAA